jgi:hypothetical protein
MRLGIADHLGWAVAVAANGPPWTKDHRVALAATVVAQAVARRSST